MVNDARRCTTQRTSPSSTTQPGPDRRVEAIVAELTDARSSQQVEGLADELASRLDRDDGLRTALLESLLKGLAGEAAHDDADTEDALCSALAQLGVMRRVGNRNFRFVPDRELTPDDGGVVRRYRGWLPSRYADGA